CCNSIAVSPLRILVAVPPESLLSSICRTRGKTLPEHKQIPIQSEDICCTSSVSIYRPSPFQYNSKSISPSLPKISFIHFESCDLCAILESSIKSCLSSFNFAISASSIGSTVYTPSNILILFIIMGFPHLLLLLGLALLPQCQTSFCDIL